MIAFTLIWLSWIVTSHLRNKEISRLIEAVNHNTNSVNLLLELTKLIFGAKFPKITNNKGDMVSDGCICEELVVISKKHKKMSLTLCDKAKTIFSETHDLYQQVINYHV